MSKPREISRYTPPAPSYASGPNHQLKAQLRRMERRGEIRVFWQEADLDRRGTLLVPYVRLKTRRTVRRGHVIRATVFLTAGGMFLAGVLWMLWESRYLIGSALAIALVTVLLLRFGPHFARGCSGLHCSGCKR